MYRMYRVWPYCPFHIHLLKEECLQLPIVVQYAAYRMWCMNDAMKKLGSSLNFLNEKKILWYSYIMLLVSWTFLRKKKPIMNVACLFWVTVVNVSVMWHSDSKHAISCFSRKHEPFEMWLQINWVIHSCKRPNFPPKKISPRWDTDFSKIKHVQSCVKYQSGAWIWKKIGVIFSTERVTAGLVLRSFWRKSSTILFSTVRQRDEQAVADSIVRLRFHFAVQRNLDLWSEEQTLLILYM